MVIHTLLHETIQDKFEELRGLDPNSKEYTVAVGNLTKLIDRAIEMEKADMEYTEQAEKREAENELRRKQILDERIDMIIKHSLTAVSIVGGFALTIWGSNKCLRFEETGTVTTIPGRNFMNKLFFWK